ncbi:tetratricopeptide repeat protein [Actinosynnema pretiosum subsp. pretiosum]|uniref:Tetratricopeptide repeat protein n=1 Tax=Actinosynnema pretiosum subsp. pretiosum TaxID=103721 RepID=A0AA45R2D6_9PSEU|nr:Transcriptional regulator, SARP family [Actinosynnema pretiosum subsp. pretiosum]QUF02478.1 tetratricopeptide repeat protein [Actinosynnema pretiosum subsp. pretiosum]
MPDIPASGNTASGDDIGSLLQVGVVHGGVVVTGAAAATGPRPRQLPLRPVPFVNRQVDLGRLDRLLRPARAQAGPALLVLVGAPGVGKTALAVHWAHRVRDRFADGALYVDMRGYGPGFPLDPSAALDGFLRALGTPPDHIPDDEADRASLFRSLLDGKRLLVVVDNARSPHQVRLLLPASPLCCTVVTSRSVLSGLVVREGAARVTLDALSPAESADLLGELIGPDEVAADRPAALRVAELCGCLPLTLRIAGERASEWPGPRLPRLEAELRDERQRLDALASPDDELSDTRVVFSWSYRALGPELRAAFRLLGLHPVPDVGVDVAAALFGVPPATATRLLRELASVSLAQPHLPGRFRVHDLLREYAAELVAARGTPAERDAAVRRSATWLLLRADRARLRILPHSATAPPPPIPDGVSAPADFADESEALRWLEDERPTLLAVLDQLVERGEHELVWKTAAAVDGFFEMRSYRDDLRRTALRAVEAATALGDHLGEALSLLTLADACWRDGSADEAVDRYHAARAAGRAAAREETGRGVRPDWVTGFAARGIGLVLTDREDHAGARGHFTESLEVFTGIGERRGAGMALLSLGQCAAGLGEFAEAVARGTEAVRIFEELADTWTAAWGRLALGRSLIAAGRPGEAAGQLAGATGVFRAFGDARSEAMSLHAHGDALTATGDPGDRALWELAAQRYEQVGDPQAAGLRARLG